MNRYVKYIAVALIVSHLIAIAPANSYALRPTATSVTKGSKLAIAGRMARKVLSVLTNMHLPSREEKVKQEILDSQNIDSQIQKITKVLELTEERIRLTTQAIKEIIADIKNGLLPEHALPEFLNHISDDIDDKGTIINATLKMLFITKQRCKSQFINLGQKKKIIIFQRTLYSRLIKQQEASANEISSVLIKLSFKTYNLDKNNAERIRLYLYKYNHMSLINSNIIEILDKMHEHVLSGSTSQMPSIEHDLNNAVSLNRATAQPVNVAYFARVFFNQMTAAIKDYSRKSSLTDKLLLKINGVSDIEESLHHLGDTIEDAAVRDEVFRESITMLESIFTNKSFSLPVEVIELYSEELLEIKYMLDSSKELISTFAYLLDTISSGIDTEDYENKTWADELKESYQTVFEKEEEIIKIIERILRYLQEKRSSAIDLNIMLRFLRNINSAA